jgi:hypothetical protein
MTWYPVKVYHSSQQSVAEKGFTVFSGFDENGRTFNFPVLEQSQHEGLAMP